LNLYSNNLTQITPGTFDTLVNLERLDLENNKLISLDKNLFKNCKKLKEIETKGNPCHSSCSIS